MRRPISAPCSPASRRTARVRSGIVMPGTSLWRNSACRVDCSGRTPRRSGIGKPSAPKRRRASSNIASTCSIEYSGWVMIRWAPAAILRSNRSHSVAASAAVGSSAQAMVNPACCPIGEPAASSPRLRRARISTSPIESTSQTPVAVGRSPIRGGSPVRARMSRTPRAWAPSSSDSSAMRLRSRVVKWTTHSRSRSCWTPKATASAPIRTLAIAESLMLTASTPAAWRSRAASIVRSMRTERGGSISTEIT